MQSKKKYGCGEIWVYYMGKMTMWVSGQWGGNCSLACDPHGHFACTSVGTYMIIIPRSPWIALFLLRLLEPKDDGTVILQKSGNYNPNDTASHSRRLVTSATLQQEPHIPEVITILKVAFYGALNMILIKCLLLTFSVTSSVYWL
jgi:hypothetical protein